MTCVGLFWLAFTTYPHVHWIVPIIASIPFGTGMLFAFTSTFTYLVTAYRPIAASAMASNSALRSLFAAVFPLFAPAIYNRLGTVGATALLAGLTTLMAPLPWDKVSSFRVQCGSLSYLVGLYSSSTESEFDNVPSLLLRKLLEITESTQCLHRCSLY